jgi:hypothetical protein
MYRNRTWCALVGCLVIALAGAASATIITIPTDFPTIQQGMNAAASEDTVLVLPGRYFENIDFKTKNLVVTSRYMFTADPNDIVATVIDGSAPTHADTASCVRIVGFQDSRTVLMGFTLTGGNGTRWQDISDAKFFREGGGILIENTSPLIAYNYIVDNLAINKTSCFSAGGGAIRAAFGEGARFIGNVIAYNQGLYGGGVVIFHYSAEFRNNIFWNNSGGNEFGGAGLWIWNSNDHAPTTVDNNTFVANNSLLHGGGLDVSNSDVFLTNNLFWGNTSPSGPQVSLGAGASTVFSYCDIQGGGIPGTSNTNEDPMFGPANLLLLPGSPCIDSGNADVPYSDREDLGNPGMALAPSLGTVRNDRGAYGGPDARLPFLFTSSQLDVSPDSVDFGTVQVGSFGQKYGIITKAGFVPVPIDSAKFAHSASPLLQILTTLPHVFAARSPSDSLTVKWQPTVKGTFRDTLLIFHHDGMFTSPLVIPLKGKAIGCCFDKTGNVNQAGIVDLADLSALVSYLTGGGYVLPCPDAANVNASGIVDLADLSALVSYLTGGGYVLPNCA